MNDRVGFLIGQDFSRYGRTPPSDATESIMAGYAAGQQTNLRCKSTRFVNKWLQLRYNAFIRDKIFSTEITPEFIEYLDTEYCPITGIKLTHATGKDTDWSIDRVSNEFDYIPTNLIIMSTRANKAKGDKSSDRIIKISTSNYGNHEGLDASEWKRMAELVQWTKFRQMSEDELDKTDSTELFISSLLKGEKPFENTSYPQVAVFQMYLLKLVETDNHIPSNIDTVLNKDKNTRLIFHKLWKRLVKRQSHYLKNEQYKQWSNQTTLVLYIKWITKLDINELGRYLVKFAGSKLASSLESIQKSEEEYLR